MDKHYFHNSVFLFFMNLMIITIFLYPGASESQTKEQGKKHRFIYNEDGTNMLGNYMHRNRQLTLEDIHEYIDILANTQITTYMICVGSCQTYYESKYQSAFGTCDDQALLAKMDPAKAKPFKIYGENIKALQAKGTNIVEIALKRAKEKGLETFLTMRMNDLHFTTTNEYLPITQGEFWVKHPEFYVGDHPGWHADGALNFAHKEVREFKLNLIKEMCEKFDFEGLELDFQRFLVYFPYKEGRKYLNEMNGFVKEVKKTIEQYSKKMRRKVLLTVKIPPRLDLCTEKGLDVKYWLKNKLIDFISVSAHWTDDASMPVREFRKEIGNPDIPIYTTVYDGESYPHQVRSQGIYRAVAANYFNEGTDGMYLFNYFFTDSILKNYPTINPMNTDLVNVDIVASMLNELGSPLTLKNKNKVYTIPENIVEYGYEMNTPLPLFLAPWDEKKITIWIADDIKNDKPLESILFIRLSKDSKILCKYNGKVLKQVDANLAEKYKRNINLRNDEEVAVFEIELKNIKQSDNYISIRSIQPSPLAIKRIDQVLKYGDVKKCGYF
jgi:hypothetical protein